MELLIRAGVAGFPHPLCIARVWALCHYVNVFQGSCSEVIDSVTNSDSSLAKMLRLAFSPICKLVLSLRNLPKKSIQHFPVCMKEPTACDFCSGWWEARLAPACSLSQHLKNKKPANQLLHLVITDHDRPRGKTTSCTLNWERHHGWRSSGSGRSRSCEAPGMSCADAPFRGGSDANSGPGGSGQGSQGTLPAHLQISRPIVRTQKKTKTLKLGRALEAQVLIGVGFKLGQPFAFSSRMEITGRATWTCFLPRALLRDAPGLSGPKNDS